MLISTKDVVIWDAHPLTIGATPVQVFIDGIAQLDDPFTVHKSGALQRVPAVPKWDCEAAQTVKWDGLPPLQGKKYSLGRGVAVRFERVKSAWISDVNGTIVNVFGEDSDDVAEKAVVLRDGNIVCVGETRDGCRDADMAETAEDLVIDLNGGSLAPALTTFGSPLGLMEIKSEPSTNDGNVWDPLTNGDPPSIIGNETIIRAVDGLQFAGRNTLQVISSFLSTLF